MSVLRIGFPHYRNSAEPRPMKAVTIWKVAEDVRQQVFGPVGRLPVDLGNLVRRTNTRGISVNGIEFTPIWDLENEVHDDDGAPVMGLCEFEDHSPDCVMLNINRHVVGDFPHLERSTALHELGHAIFDGPVWIKEGRQLRLPLGDRPGGRRVYRLITPDEGHLRSSRKAGVMDWGEFRANEFMGAFLVPPGRLHRSLARLANAIGLPMVFKPSLGREGFPVVDCRAADIGDIQTVVEALAEEFGVSLEFIGVRLAKYRLLAGCP